MASEQDLLTGFENVLGTMSQGLPIVGQVVAGIKAAEQAYTLVTTLINDSKDVLSPADLTTVQSSLNDAIAARKLQQAITDAVLSKAAQH